MTYPSLDHTRVVNPILTSVMHGFKQPTFIGELAFPRVTVPTRKGKIIRFNEDEFYLHQLRRAPGANTMRVNGGWGADDYELFQDAIEEELPIEHLQEAEAVLPLDMQSRSIKKAAARIALRLEFDQITLLADVNSYPAANRIILGGPTQLSNAASDLEATFDAAFAAVLAGCGMLPNTIIWGYRAWLACKRHPLVRDKIKYTTSNAVTMEMMLAMLGATRGGVAAARYRDPSNPGLGRIPMAMDNAIAVLYVPDAAVNDQVGMMPGVEADMAQPSFGYTYQLDPFAEEPYYERNTKTWYFPATADRRPVLTGMGAGYLMLNVAA